MASTIAPSALTGFANASSYDQHRPSYPMEAVDSLLSHLQIKDVTGARVVDLGAGTGKFTALLPERGENYNIVAVEPHEAMRKELESKRMRRVTVLAGDATSMSLESQSVDAVIASQVALPLSMAWIQSSVGESVFIQFLILKWPPCSLSIGMQPVARPSGIIPAALSC